MTAPATDSMSGIVAGLSDDVIVALRDAQTLGADKCLHWSTAGTVVRACRSRGLVEVVGKCLTPLGLAIRQHMEKES